MHEALMEQKAMQKKHREEMKKLTLKLDKQMAIQQQEEVCKSYLISLILISVNFQINKAQQMKN